MTTVDQPLHDDHIECREELELAEDEVNQLRVRLSDAEDPHRICGKALDYMAGLVDRQAKRAEELRKCAGVCNVATGCVCQEIYELRQRNMGLEKQLEAARFFAARYERLYRELDEITHKPDLMCGVDSRFLNRVLKIHSAAVKALADDEM